MMSSPVRGRGPSQQSHRERRERVRRGDIAPPVPPVPPAAEPARPAWTNAYIWRLEHEKEVALLAQGRGRGCVSTVKEKAVSKSVKAANAIVSDFANCSGKEESCEGKKGEQCHEVFEGKGFPSISVSLQMVCLHLAFIPLLEIPPPSSNGGSVQPLHIQHTGDGHEAHRQVKRRNGNITNMMYRCTLFHKHWNSLFFSRSVVHKNECTAESWAILPSLPPHRNSLVCLSALV
uniref:Uncharacterized protein n=1 Tax=Chromera velia CCMP2878 TaxID=1169474 RepID=A0A0G4HIR2_9ALVE|eukprot:Cvel_27953.t1-p1 / transcript=Cvel_27953.t1 / gene=Cvel_27953 / organism=Chromera_velia_CCMP2878 / gene_product=hypothetical protein / transcript_product=hypothetical protein / location=Cvel_scaffold3568:1287-2707(-) / protein_length=232 / sequence_SO=supercontig / SO=protein_coding / is_pseudo=false